MNRRGFLSLSSSGRPDPHCSIRPRIAGADPRARGHGGLCRAVLLRSGDSCTGRELRGPAIAVRMRTDARVLCRKQLAHLKRRTHQSREGACPCSGRSRAAASCCPAGVPLPKPLNAPFHAISRNDSEPTAKDPPRGPPSLVAPKADPPGPPFPRGTPSLVAPKAAPWTPLRIIKVPSSEAMSRAPMS